MFSILRGELRRDRNWLPESTRIRFGVNVHAYVAVLARPGASGEAMGVDLVARVAVSEFR